MHFTSGLKLMTAVSLLSFCLSSCSGAVASEPITEQYSDDQLYELCSGEISENISAAGKLSSSDEVKVQGINEVLVNSVFVKKGDIVRKGDKLFSYDFEEIQNELDELKQEYNSQSEYIDYRHALNCRNLEQARSNGDANINQAQSDWANAINERDSAYSSYNSIIDDINSAPEQFPQTDEGKEALEARYAELRIKEAAAAERINSSESAVTQADRMLVAARRESEANIQSMQDNIDAEKYDTSLVQLSKQIKEKEEKIISDTITAPVDGIISELNVSAKEEIRGESAVIITSCDKLFASVQVGRSDIYTVTPRCKADLIIGDCNETVTATVSRISHVAERDTDTFTVELTPDDKMNIDGVFLGMEITARIYTKIKENVLKAPYSFIRTDNGHDYYVLKVKENSEGIMETLNIPVQIGISTATEAEIYSDELHEGDRLLIK